MQTEIELKCDDCNNQITKQELGKLYEHSISMWEYFLAFELTIRSHTLHISTARTKRCENATDREQPQFQIG